MNGAPSYPRFAREPLLEALADSPVVLIHGPRQCGKTTLARTACEPLGYRYVTFDDEVSRAAALADPVGFVGDLPPKTILDEAQRVPEVFASIKRAVDRDRVPGRFVLTGSANVLLVPRLSDSLAGRLEILRLHPLAQAEVAGRPPTFLRRLFEGRFPSGPAERLGDGLLERVVAGGYPAALARSTPRRRTAWYRNYVEALVQRDVRDLSRIAALDSIPRLLAAVAAGTAGLLNVSGLAAPFRVSRPTIDSYLTLLERIFLVDQLPAWHANRLSRLVKAPKIHLGDTGVACALLGLDAAALKADRTALGPLLETFVFQELRRHASWNDPPVAFFHFRDRDGVEVDLVLERSPREIAGVEIKAGATVRSDDFHGLRKLQEAAGRNFRAGVVLHDGEMCATFGEGLFAVPIRALWEPDAKA